MSFLLWSTCSVPMAAATQPDSNFLSTHQLAHSVQPLHAAYPFDYLLDPPSSDDSNNSEQLDLRIADDLHQPPHDLPPTTPTPRRRRRRRSWRIQRLPPPDMHTARIQRDNVLRRETPLKDEAYIGDAGSTPTLDMQVDILRIAATNINKNTYGKLSAELATCPQGHTTMDTRTWGDTRTQPDGC
ncbi:hypothetical protein H257_09063 [Aphanomyces astaci]|uniref:Uncharacterized protein n=1 Tax=Aphanomyces astaci TaxID=112090 RepID=W4GBX0_APHAT|nr:hypothetical protein H257_09063 [Aphanomyces astaci]ETV77177.1 hypothetical protein H257_09063 [Aphanomyces astaci]|eukprot:XP_009833483.1 hypothetical protein H257_09063 [Aphanomyces astaci]